MSARKWVEKFIKDHELEPNYQTAAYRSFDTDDLRAVLKLAREAAELRRRVRLARREATETPPFGLRGTSDLDDALNSRERIAKLLDLRKPLPKRGRR